VPYFDTKVPYYAYEGQEPGLAGYAGSTMQGLGQAGLSTYFGAKLAATPATLASLVGPGGSAIAGSAPLAAPAAALSPLMPIAAIGIGIIGALLSAAASKPKQVKKYQTIPARERQPLQVPQGLGVSPGRAEGATRSRQLAQSYGQLPPGFRV